MQFVRESCPAGRKAGPFPGEPPLERFRAERQQFGNVRLCTEARPDQAGDGDFGIGPRRSVIVGDDPGSGLDIVREPAVERSGNGRDRLFVQVSTIDQVVICAPELDPAWEQAVMKTGVLRLHVPEPDNLASLIGCRGQRPQKGAHAAENVLDLMS